MTGGFFTLTFNAQVTQPIPFGASAATVKAALAALGTIGGAANVDVSGSVGATGGVYYVTFKGALAGRPVGAVTVNSALRVTTGAAFFPVLQQNAGFAVQTGTGAVTMNVGRTISSTIDTGSNAIVIVGTLTVQPAQAGGASVLTTGSSNPATIAGNIDLGGAARSITLNDSFIPGAADDLLISANISGLNATATLATALPTAGLPGFALGGTVALTGVNTFPGAFTVAGGTTVVLRGATGGTIAGAPSVTVASSNALNAGQGVLILDNSGGNYVGSQGRIGDATTLALTGGLFSFIGNTSGSATTETIGALTLNAATSFVSTIQSTAGLNNQALTFLEALTRNANTDINFVGIGSDIGSINNRIFFTGISENQIVDFSVLQSDNLGGSYTLSFNGVLTAAINTTDPLTGAGSIQSKIDAVLGAGNTLASLVFNNGTNLNKGGLLRITFQGDLATTNVPTMQVNGASLTGTNHQAPATVVATNLNQVTVAGQTQGAGNEFQLLTYTTVAAGANNLTFNLGGQSTTASFNGTVDGAARLQLILEGLANIGSGNVKVIGPAIAASGSIYSIVFLGALASATFPLLTVFPAAGVIAIAAFGAGSTAGIIPNPVSGANIAPLAALVNTTLPFALLAGANGPDFVRYNDTSGINAAPFVTTLVGASPTANVKLTASSTVTGDQTVNALMLIGNGVNVSGGNTLQVRTGLVASYGAGGTNEISTGLRFVSGTGATSAAMDPLFFVDPSSTLKVSGPVSAPINEVQTVNTGASVLTFTLTFPAIPGVGLGGTTAALTRATATGDDVQRALQSIAALAGNVNVTGAATGPYIVTFINALAGLNVPSLTAATASSTVSNTDNTMRVTETTRGGDLSAVVNEDQTVVVGQNVASWQWTFNGVTGAAALSYTAGSTTPGAVSTSLTTNFPALSGNISVSGPNGGPYVVTFVGALAGQDANSLGTINVLPSGTAVQVTETAKGGINLAALATAPSALRKEFGGALFFRATIPLSLAPSPSTRAFSTSKTAILWAG